MEVEKKTHEKKDEDENKNERRKKRSREARDTFAERGEREGTIRSYVYVHV